MIAPSSKRNQRRSLAVALTLLAGAPASALVGPTSPAPAFEDHMVMLLHRAAKSAGFCSAVVLASDVVLTAAHCVGAPADLRVYVRDTNGTSIFLQPDAVAVHPGYRADAQINRKVSIDLALVHLREALPGRFRPVVLSATAAAEPGSPVRLVGFGVMQEGEAASSGHLRLATAEVRDPRSAVLLWASAPDGAGACTGDSGGGIFGDATSDLLAVIAWAQGTGGKKCGALTQATWVAPHRAWIAAVRDRWAKMLRD